MDLVQRIRFLVHHHSIRIHYSKICSKWKGLFSSSFGKFLVNVTIFESSEAPSMRCTSKNHQIWQKFSKKIKTILPETISPYMGFGYWSITSSHHFLCRIIPSLSGPFIHALVDKCFLGLNDFFLIIKALDAQLAKNGKTVQQIICVRVAGFSNLFVAARFEFQGTWF